EYAVEDGGGKGVDMSGDIPRPHRTPQHPLQIVPRSAPLDRADAVEIRGDRIQAGAGDAASTVPGNATDQADGQAPTALGAAFPVVLAHVPASPASTSSPRASSWSWC